MASSEPQLSEQTTQDGDETKSDQSALRAFEREIVNDLSHSPLQKGEKVYPKPVVEPLDRLPFSTRTAQSFDKGIQLIDESSNPYKNKREDNKPVKLLSSSNPYRHKSKWIYETQQFAADSNYDSDNNSVHYFFHSNPQDSQQLSQNQELINEQLKNLQLNQNQLYQQQMQNNAVQQQQQQQQQQLEERQKYERMMQLQNNFMQFQSQLQNQGAFVDNANIPQNMFASNFQLNNPNFPNQTATNYPFNNNAPPSFTGFATLQSQQPNNGIIDLNRANNNCNQLQVPSNFTVNAQSTPQQPFIASQRSAFLGNQGYTNNEQIQFHNQAQPFYNQQMQMPFQPNVPINMHFNGPLPAFYMQNMNANGLDFINDPMRNINPEFNNAVPIRF